MQWQIERKLSTLMKLRSQHPINLHFTVSGTFSFDHIVYTEPVLAVTSLKQPPVLHSQTKIAACLNFVLIYICKAAVSLKEHPSAGWLTQISVYVVQ